MNDDDLRYEKDHYDTMQQSWLEAEYETAAINCNKTHDQETKNQIQLMAKQLGYTEYDDIEE